MVEVASEVSNRDVHGNEARTEASDSAPPSAPTEATTERDLSEGVEGDQGNSLKAELQVLGEKLASLAAGKPRATHNEDREFDALLELAERTNERIDSLHRMVSLRRVVTGGLFALCGISALYFTQSGSNWVWAAPLAIGIAAIVAAVEVHSSLRSRRRLAQEMMAQAEAVQIIRESLSAIAVSHGWSPIKLAHYKLALSRFQVGSSEGLLTGEFLPPDACRHCSGQGTCRSGFNQEFSCKTCLRAEGYPTGVSYNDRVVCVACAGTGRYVQGTGDQIGAIHANVSSDMNVGPHHPDDGGHSSHLGSGS